MILDNLDSKLNNQVAILICGHGSRNKLAITEFQELTKFIQKRYPNFLVEYGFLEFAKPSLVDALDKLRDLSIKKVIAIPECFSLLAMWKMIYLACSWIIQVKQVLK